jgi:hypothetical protein
MRRAIWGEVASQRSEFVCLTSVYLIVLPFCPTKCPVPDGSLQFSLIRKPTDDRDPLRRPSKTYWQFRYP